MSCIVHRLAILEQEGRGLPDKMISDILVGGKVINARRRWDSMMLLFKACHANR